jgi:hypothetical protein
LPISTFCFSCPWAMILPISTSQITKIIDVIHWCPADFLFLNIYTLFIETQSFLYLYFKDVETLKQIFIIYIMCLFSVYVYVCVYNSK